MAKKFKFDLDEPDELGKMYDAKEIAEIIDMHPVTVRELLKAGTIKSLRIGSRYKVPKKFLVEFLERSSTSIGKKDE